MTSPAEHRQTTYRHTLPVRLTHWITVLCVIVLLMSGLQIFNAHTALYWGERSDPGAAVFQLHAAQKQDGTLIGLTTIGNTTFTTTGWLGAVKDSSGNLDVNGFPSWLTIPSYRDLATGRRWHFFFAWLFVLNGIAYLAYALLSGHLRRDLAPTRPQLRNIPRDVRDHLRLRFPKGEEAKHYNVLQKLAYLAVIFVLLPLAVLSGLTMSPALNAAFPFMLDFFGGRQSARTIHFICATGITLFVLVHVVMVLLSGLWNNLRSMVTGRYDIEPAE